MREVLAPADRRNSRPTVAGTGARTGLRRSCARVASESRRRSSGADRAPPVRPLSRHTRLPPGRARPCGRRRRLAWQTGRQPPQQGWSPRVRHGRQQTAGGSRRRHGVHRGRRPAPARWRRGGDHLPAPRPQIKPPPAQRSLRPKSRRRGARAHSASAEKPYQHHTHAVQTGRLRGSAMQGNLGLDTWARLDSRSEPWT